MPYDPSTGEYIDYAATTTPPDPWFDQFTVPTGSEGPGGITGRGPLVVDAETPQQKYDRFFRDYHSADRDAVLQQMRADMGALAGGYIPPTDPSTGNSGPLPVTNPSASRAGGAGATDTEAFRAAWFASGGRTVDDLARFVAANPQYGAQITGSKKSKLVFPNGQEFQAVRSAGIGGGIGPAWDDLSSGAGSSGGTFGAAVPWAGLGGPILQPWEQQFQPGAETNLQPWNTPFVARDPSQIANDPAYQFQLQQGLQGIERSAAAKGTLLTGGTLKAITGYGQGLASQYNDKYYGRDVGEYDMNRANYMMNQNTAKDLYGRQLGQYGLARENFYANQDRPFDKLYKLSTLGLSAT